MSFDFLTQFLRCFHLDLSWVYLDLEGFFEDIFSWMLSSEDLFLGPYFQAQEITF